MATRNFRLYFCGQAVSQTGTWVQAIAMNWLVLQLSGNSGLALGLATALEFLPVLVFTAWAGVLADRVDKRLLIKSADTFMAATCGALALLQGFGAVRLWMVYVAAFVIGLGQAVELPARQAFLSEVVDDSHLVNAIALNSVIANIARLAGPALGGIFLVLVGTAPCFAINAVSFVAVVLALHLMRVEELHPSALVPRRPKQVREGLRYVASVPDVRDALLVMVVVGTFAFNFTVVFPLLAKLTFGGTAATYSAMTTVLGVGAMAASGVMAIRTTVTERAFLVATLTFGTMLCVAAATPSLAMMWPVLFLVGMSWVAFVTVGNTYIQIRVPPAMRGRVLAMRVIAFVGTTPIGAPLIGWLSQRYGPRFGLLLGGTVTLASAVYFGFVRRKPGLPSRSARRLQPSGLDGTPRRGADA